MKRCSQCQQPMACMASTACWCMDYPALLTAAELPNRDADCLCPNCLTQQTQAAIAARIDTQAVHHQASAAAQTYQHLPLMEGLDYTIENGRWVLSRWYLLKRGDCCGNGCRNCPYGHRHVQVDRSNVVSAASDQTDRR